MDSNSPPKFIPVRVYVALRMHRELKAKLAMKGLTVSEWFRNKAQEEIDE